jgi:small-conductance mechanosensitive channel
VACAAIGVSLLTGIACTARAEGDAAPSATAAPAAAPVADVGARAEEVAAILREMIGSLSDEPAFVELEGQVRAQSARIGQRWTVTEQMLGATPHRLALASLEISWRVLRQRFESLRRNIEARAQRREANVATLNRLRDTWSRSLEDATAVHAPESVLARARATLAAIEATRVPIEQRRGRVLVLQDEVSRGMQTCDDALDRVAAVQRLRLARLLVDREPPLWDLPLRRSADGATIRIDPELDVASDDPFVYLRRHGASIAGTVAVFVALAVILRNGSAAGSLLARTPWAAAIPLAIVLTRPLRPEPPPVLREVLVGLAAVAAARVLRPRVTPRLAALLYWFTALFFVMFASEVLDLPPAFRRAAPIVEMVAAALLLFGMALDLDRHPIASSGRAGWVRSVPYFVVLAGTACLASAGAWLIGYTAFGEWLGTGTFYVGLLSIAVVAFRIGVGGLVEIALARSPLSRLRTVAQHRIAVDRAVGAVLDGVTWLFWIWFLLLRFDLLDSATASALGVVHARIRIGELDFAVGRLFGFVVVVAGAYLVTRILVFLLEEDVYSRMELPRGVPYALSTLTRYGLLLAGFLLALATLGLDLTRITVLVSAFGLGIGFGLQQIVNNFVSGLILLFERPVQVGDSVQLGDLTGFVDRIGIRSSTIRTDDGAEVIVPNSRIIDERVTNWTLSDRRRCVTLELTIAGTGDAGQLIDLLVDTVRRDPRVCAKPAPEALLIRFGEEHAEFQLRVWTEAPEWTRLRSELGIHVQRALRERARPV